MTNNKIAVFTEAEISELVRNAYAEGLEYGAKKLKQSAPLLTAARLAEMLGCSAAKIRIMADNGEITSHRIGVEYRFDFETVKGEIAQKKI
jgi:excisionase family DNA binding protein